MCVCDLFTAYKGDYLNYDNCESLPVSGKHIVCFMAKTPTSKPDSDFPQL